MKHFTSVAAMRPTIVVSYTATQTLAQSVDAGAAPRTRSLAGTLLLQADNGWEDARTHLAGCLAVPGGAGSQATIRAAASAHGTRVSVEDMLFTSEVTARGPVLRRDGTHGQSVSLAPAETTTVSTAVVPGSGVGAVQTVWTITVTREDPDPRGRQPGRAVRLIGANGIGKVEARTPSNAYADPVATG